VRRTRSSEPLWWIPFAGGMMLDALVLPALILITGILLPLGLVSPETLHVLVGLPVVRVALAVLIALTFFHAAHRLRYALVELGLHALKPVLPWLCYGGAVVGSAYTLLVAFRLI